MVKIIRTFIHINAPAKDADFNEADHPREDDGKFGKGASHTAPVEKLTWHGETPAKIKEYEEKSSANKGVSLSAATNPETNGRYHPTVRAYHEAYHAPEEGYAKLKSINALKKKLLNSNEHMSGPVIGIHHSLASYLKNAKGISGSKAPAAQTGQEMQAARIGRYLTENRGR